MKNNIPRMAMYAVMLVVLVVCTECEILNSRTFSDDRDSATSIDIEYEDEDCNLYYVTGVSETVALRQSNGDNGEMLALLECGTEVRLLSDDTPKPDTNDPYEVYKVTGIPSYLILISVPEYDTTKEIARLNNGEKVYVYSTETYGEGDKYWYVYYPKDKLWGYANKNYLKK